MSVTNKLKGYRIECDHYAAEGSITVAETRGKAILTLFTAAKDCGYEIKWTEFRAYRQREFDGVQKLVGIGIIIKYASSYLQ